jgi:threonine aldolase
VLGSIQPQPLEHQADGSIALADIEAAIKPDDAHFAKTKLLCLENTTGGKVLPMAYVQAACELAKSRGLKRHLDGARLFNAAVKLKVPAKTITQHFDSVSVCFSKGLGTPVGSALCGSKAFIARAHRWRKMTGGGMRQAGMLAAAATYALDHHVQRLADDHALAQRLADGLRGIKGLTIDEPQTNILFVDVAKDKAQSLVDALKAQGVLITGLYRLRFVTHLNVDAGGVDRAIAAVKQAMA